MITKLPNVSFTVINYYSLNEFLSICKRDNKKLLRLSFEHILQTSFIYFSCAPFGYSFTSLLFFIFFKKKNFFFDVLVILVYDISFVNTSKNESNELKL